jgi:hypothetical protein
VLDTYTDDEWGLLVGLPQSVVIATSAIEPDTTRKSLVESEAGFDAITLGRGSGSPLVDAVAQQIVDEVGVPGEEELRASAALHLAELPVIEPDDPAGYARDVLDRATAAYDLLEAKAGEGDAAAYRHWLVTIAEAVATAARTGDVMGIGGELVSEAERRFIARLARTLED